MEWFGLAGPSEPPQCHPLQGLNTLWYMCVMSVSDRRSAAGKGPLSLQQCPGELSLIVGWLPPCSLLLCRESPQKLIQPYLWNKAVDL